MHRVVRCGSQFSACGSHLLGNHLRSFQLYDVVLQWERPPATAASPYVSVVSAGVSDASFGFRLRRVLGPRWQLKHHRLLTLFKAG